MTLRPGGYVSPFPAKEQPNYALRIEGAAVIERLHNLPTSDGGTVPCNPVYCRECERERTWKEGQTRGI
ncbi:hypothetical protein [Sphingobium yanoikuyae]|uniref:hypothetical protein n=1 Tax=Sphingobium yanoikuyae TaxID=13690 RepID=UPI00242FC3D3|nr:hypothetical protein [Sphingobium yanoikuyae]